MVVVVSGGCGGKQNSRARHRPSGLSAFGHWLRLLRGHDSRGKNLMDFTLSTVENDVIVWKSVHNVSINTVLSFPSLV